MVSFVSETLYYFTIKDITMYKLRFRQVHLDFHTSECIGNIGKAFDKNEWQQKLLDACVDSITCFSLCHHGWSYHPTEVGKTHPVITSYSIHYTKLYEDKFSIFNFTLSIQITCLLAK